jgi:hypothetical protein
MKNLLTYEQYLPYFGVKQALDDSKQYMTNEEKSSDFHRVYTMNSTWWIAWKKENGSDYGIKQDAFSKTYEVSKNDKVLFIYDYNRNKLFTNEPANFFILKNDLDQKEFDEVKDTSDDLGKPEDEKKNSKENSKEENKEEE